MSCSVSFPKEGEDLFSGLKAPGNKMHDLYKTLKNLCLGSLHFLRLTGEHWHFVSRRNLLQGRCLTLNCFSADMQAVLSHPDSFALNIFFLALLLFFFAAFVRCF